MFTWLVKRTIHSGLDTTIGYGGRARNRLMRSLPVGDNPTFVAVEPCTDAACETNEEGFVFVSVFDDQRLLVIDPMGIYMIARIDVGRTPHDISFGRLPDGRRVAFVVNFDAGSVTIVNIEPGTENRFQIIECL